MTRRMFLLLLLTIGVPGFLSAESISNNKPVDFGFIVPMPSEADYVCRQYFDGCKHTVIIDKVKFYLGHVDQHSAVLAISGVGAVNTTIVTTLMTHHFQPSVTALMGSSGGINPTLKEGDVVIGGEVYDYNFGTFNAELAQPTYPKTQQDELINPNNEEKMPLVFGVNHQGQELLKVSSTTVSDYKKHPLSPKADTDKNTYHPSVKIGIIADSSIFPTPNSTVVDLAKANVDVIAFEDTAFLQTCWLYQKDCFAVRSVSNLLPINKTNPDALAEKAGVYAAKVAVEILLKTTKI